MSTSKYDLDASQISYTSRDYESLVTDLINSIPLLTDKWIPYEETDPGVVLVKLMAMLGDMLSYNLDKKALEMFPLTVQERVNAYQIFNLTGYKMKWYRSATVDLTLENYNLYTVFVPRFVELSNVNNSSISYILINDENKSLDSGQENESGINPSIESFTAVEGKLYSPSVMTNILSSRYSDWHDPYNYNLYASEIVDNCYYIQDNNIDQDHIYLVDSNGQEWVMVDDVDLEITTDYCFEFNSDKGPYIKLKSTWNKDENLNFKLFYIISNGSNGYITSNTLDTINTNLYGYIANDGSIEQYTIADILQIIINQANPSTIGYDTESIKSARREYKTYRNTINTLVTLDDYTNYCKRHSEIANAKAVDILTDPNLAGVENKLKDLAVRIYYIENKDSDYSLDAIESELLTILNQYKHALNTVELVRINSPEDEETKTNISKNYKTYYWKPEGVIYLTKPLVIESIDNIISTMNTLLINDFNRYEVDFNTVPRYIDVIETLNEASSYVNYINLKGLKFYEDMECEHEVEAPEITGNTTYTLPNDNLSENIYTSSEKFKINLFDKTFVNNEVLSADNSKYVVDSISNMITVVSSTEFSNATHNIYLDNTLIYTTKSTDTIINIVGVSEGDRKISINKVSDDGTVSNKLDFSVTVKYASETDEDTEINNKLTLNIGSESKEIVFIQQSAITPGSLIFKYNNVVITDDNLGNVISFKSNTFNGVDNTIDYASGLMSFELNEIVSDYTEFDVSYNLNRITICEYLGNYTGYLDTEVFYVAPEYQK